MEKREPQKPPEDRLLAVLEEHFASVPAKERKRRWTALDRHLPAQALERARKRAYQRSQAGAGDHRDLLEERRNDLELTSQNGIRKEAPSWATVARVVRHLQEGQPISFCCLASADLSYVQNLHGINGWHVEWRVTNSMAP
jgi:hypothetical protein